MQDIILDKLSAIEKENNIKILYAIESGSRGWGFASKDSDYDVRFIYTHPTDWYLSIEDKKDFIEVPIDDLLDINGWDIRKSLQQYKKSNPTLMEWLSSPIVYMETIIFKSTMVRKICSVGYRTGDLIPCGYDLPGYWIDSRIDILSNLFNQAFFH